MFNENKMEDILTKVIEFSSNAHEFHFIGEGPQLRKYTNESYIVHPIIVCNTCKQYTKDICILSAALLHDVLEDTTITKEQILEFLLQYLSEEQAKRTLMYVIELTDVYTKEKYPELNRVKRKELEVERMSKISPEAQTVKYADIIDNAPSIIKNDPKFTPVFISEAMEKLKVMTKGNKILRQKALESLNI